MNRIQTLFLGGAVSVLLCAGFLIFIETPVLESLYHKLGFYWTFATFFFWLYLLTPQQLSHQGSYTFLAQHWLALLAAGLLSGLVLFAIPSEFRILADETNLLGIAAAMYDQHSFYNLSSGHYYYHSFHEAGHVWGIRPTFFPFLVFLTHTFLGYSVDNGFIVNALANVVCLVSFYWLLSRWYSKPLALFGMLCLAAFPVYVLWVRSTGFEIVNLSFSILAFCFLHQFLSTKAPIHLERLVVTLVLLAQVRYESIIFAAAMGLIVLIQMRARDYSKLSYRAWLWPLLFLPTFLQRAIKTQSNDYQVNDGAAVFAWEYFAKHAPLALDYFLATQQRFGTIGYLFILAAIGLISGLIIGTSKVAIHWRRHQWEWQLPLMGVVCAAILAYSALSVAVFSYYWGNLQAAFTIRLGIIYLPLLICLALLPIHLLINIRAGFSPHFSNKLLSIALIIGIAQITYFWPIAGKNESVNQLTLFRHYKSVLSFLDKHYPSRNVLIVSDRPGMYAVHRWGSVSFSHANLKSAQYNNELKRRLYTEILVIQEIDYRTDQPLAHTKLHRNYGLETVFEEQTKASSKMRISKVIPTP